MTLQNKVEKFLSNAEIILFVGDEKEVLISVNFSKTKFDIFRQVDNYKDLNEYFEGRNITLSIIEQDTYYRASLIDTNTGDTINLHGVNFVTDNLEKAVNGIPTDTEMPFFIYGFSADGTTRVMQYIVPGSKPLIVHGYSFVYKK